MRNNFLKEYFNFSKRERNGILVLIFILISIFTFKIILNKSNEDKRVDFSEFESEIDQFISYQTPDFSKERFYFDPNTASAEELLNLGLSPKSVNGIIEYREKDWKFYKPEDLLRVRDLNEEEYEYVKDYIAIPKKSYKSNYKYQYPENSNNWENSQTFYFDPNTATKEELESLGFSSRQSDNIIKYREKGGVFTNPEDISKIYGLDDDFIDRIKPWIAIDTTIISTNAIKVFDNSEISMEINAATEAELQQLNGIGPSYSRRIVEYRDKLGGFINIDQLMEVYGFTDELFESVKNSFTINLDNVEKLNINKAKFAEIISHPYFDKEITLNIINYKKFAGEIHTVDELLKQKAMSEDNYNKILPYITCE